MNLSIYGIGSEARRTWLAVDLGVLFGNEEQPGIDLVMPDVRFLAEERRNLVGIVLTHGHEDHLGALIDLWPQLRVPVYATPFTAALFTAKRLGEPGAPDIPIQVVEQGSRFALGPFDIEIVPVAHSIPESNALIIRTALGTVLHTGDWKLDPTPVIGLPTDEARLRAVGDEGVLALVGDSTNAVREGRSPSEVDVAETLTELITSAPGRVAVTTFASNVARIRSAAVAAFAAGREVVVVGRAMERVIQVARETGYLDGIGDFRSVDVYGHLPPDKVMALCTGSQGEARAALARIAADEHPEVTLNEGDRVIFSSRTIPGNERSVNRIINGLVRMGIEVITDRNRLVHVSGHPRRAELEQMYQWVRPRIAIPVHGEALHLREHADLARRAGVAEVIICQDGDLVRLAPGPAGIVDEVPVARLYKDGRILVEADGRTVPERRRLGFAGVVSVAVAVTRNGELAADPEVELTGIPPIDGDGVPMAEVAQAAAIETFEQLPRAQRRDADAIAESVTRGVRSAIAARWTKKPVCHVHVLTV
ncbi:MAG TPA: ribonuclease J [Xanthobacteraceae bacterium]|nr:ribonuclease J [Xanthobacteraceae bacterium]